MAEGIDFSFDAITADEHERLQALYTTADASGAAVDRRGYSDRVPTSDTIREAQAAIEAVAENAREHDRRHVAAPGRRHGVRWRGRNPVTGLRNAIAPPMVMHQEPDGLWWSEFELGEAYQGPPGWVHGGVLALVLDQLLGEAASDGLTKPMFTGTITLRYLRGTPLGRLRAEAAIERTDGVQDVRERSPE